MEHVINLSVVNFRAVWGNKDLNLERICSYVKAAARAGSDMVILPELALCGYDPEPEIEFNSKMHVRLAETIPGKSTETVSELAQELCIYVVFGLPEQDKKDPARVYNSAAICAPDGTITSCRKLHLPENEPTWATRGDYPTLFQTPWGPVGVAICYDFYAFPEIVRWASAKGCRLFINPTACCASAVPGRMVQTQLEALVITSPIYVASANLAGWDRENYFIGGSSIAGPAGNIGDVKYFAGYPFYAEGSDSQEMYTASIDLSLSEHNTFTHLFKHNEKIGEPDWRPELYVKMYNEILSSSEWKNLSTRSGHEHS